MLQLSLTNFHYLFLTQYQAEKIVTDEKGAEEEGVKNPPKVSES